jgi:hypothetical protein
MSAPRTLITIVTEDCRFDLSVPSALAIRDWLPALLDPGPGSPGPGNPTLALAGATPLSPKSSLDDAGAVDGAVLHLLRVWPGEESD